MTLGEENRCPDCAEGGMPAEAIERLASAAFEWDSRNGHHKGGPWTWHMIGADGQENYRGLVRAVLTELATVRAALDEENR